MNFRRGQRRDEPEINFIPLIDLLLVILIFLMVTTTYARYGELKLDLPRTAAEHDASRRPDELVVAVTRDGRYAVGDAAAAARDASALAGDLAGAARGRAAPLVVIHADADATHQAVIAVLEAARLAGLERVTFSTQKAR